MNTTTSTERRVFGRRGALKIGLLGLGIPALRAVPLDAAPPDGASRDSFVIVEWYKPEDLAPTA